MALEPKVLKLEGSYFGNMPYIYVLKGDVMKLPKKVSKSGKLLGPLLHVGLNLQKADQHKKDQQRYTWR